MTKEQRTAAFLAWYDGMLKSTEWSSEQVARKGDFDSSLITKYRTGEKNVGQDVVARAARAFGYDDAMTLRLLQKLQLVPGGIDDTKDGKVQEHARHFASLILEIDDENEQERIIGIVDAIIRQAVKRNRGSRSALP